jgi:endo-1,4-beta-D-glucanase Y
MLNSVDMRKGTFLVILLSVTTIFGFSQINSSSPTVPFGSRTSYSYGRMPTNLPTGGVYGGSQDAANAYTAWKNAYVETCGTNGSRVKWVKQGDMAGSQTVSEGIAYGMLVAAYAGDKPLFDNLWKYYKRFSSNGLMGWLITGCNTVADQGGATDADLDAAMALLIAREQWPSATTPYNYQVEAGSLLQSIRTHEIHPSTFQTLNGNTWNNDCRNPSYQSPAYYRQFAIFEPTHASTWNSAITASHTLLLANRNSTTGLVGNWCNTSGTSNNCGATPNEYGYDAIRTPWRMAIDVLWHGTATATAANDICTKMASWMSGHETNLRLPYAQNVANPSSGSNAWKNGSSVMSGLVTMAVGTQQAVNTVYSQTVGIPIPDAYFNDALRLLSLFTLTGNFWAPGASGAAVPPIAQNLTTNADGTKISITFSKAMATPATNQTASFTLRKNGTIVTSAFTAIARPSAQVIELTLSAGAVPIPGDQLTLSYTPGTIQSSDNVSLAAFTNVPVLNALAGNNTLMADAEFDNATNFGTFWYSYNDNGEGGVSVVTPLSTVDDPFTTTPGGANGTANAIKVDYTLGVGTLTYNPFIGFGFNTKEAETAFDLSGSTGISFWHKGDGVSLQVGLATNTNTNYYSAAIPPSANWTLVELDWTEFAQANWGAGTGPVAWDPSQITKFQWQKQAATGSGEIWVDEVTLVGLYTELPGPNSADPDEVNKTLLAAAITSATTLHTTSVEGSAAGQYPAGSKATLLQAINNASLVNSNVDATQIEVDAALLALNTAVSTFQASANGAPPGGNTLIADCEDENITKLQTFWYSYAAGQSTISPLASVTVPFEMTAGGANGTAHAAAVTGSLAYPGAPVATGQPGYESAGIGFSLLDPEADYDLTGATGISFYHKGDAINFSVIISTTAQDAGHDYSYAVPASVNWQLVTVNFPGQGAPAIAQPAWVGTTLLVSHHGMHQKLQNFNGR